MEHNLVGTRQAARLLGIPPNRLNRAVWDGRIPEPPRSPAGQFLWGDEDVRRACRILLGKDMDSLRREEKLLGREPNELTNSQAKGARP